MKITNDIEQERMVNLLNRFDPGFEKEFWLGLTDVETEGIFLWEDGSSLSHKNWNVNEPDNCCGGQDCAQVQK